MAVRKLKMARFNSWTIYNHYAGVGENDMMQSSEYVQPSQMPKCTFEILGV